MRTWVFLSDLNAHFVFFYQISDPVKLYAREESISIVAIPMKSNLFLVIRVWVLMINCLFDTLGRIAAVATAKKVSQRLAIA